MDIPQKPPFSDVWHMRPSDRIRPSGPSATIISAPAKYGRMLGYTVPAYGRLSPADLSLYRRYYCETCHQLRDGFGLTGTLTVNYDMTFNTVLLCGITGQALDVGPTEKTICVLEHSKTDADLMHAMAAYTLILTKWELHDDDTDDPSLKNKAISLTLNRAIQKAVREYPEYDAMVGEGFSELRKLELDSCKDARLMGRTFGKGLIGALEDIAGDFYTPELGEVFTELSTAVYIMDAIDDLDEDFMEGTYNPLLPDTGFVNARRYIDGNVFRFTDLVNQTVGGMQSSYSKVRVDMKGNVSLCDNIVYFGIPESARRVISGGSQAKASIKNMFSNRSARMSDRSRGVVERAHVQLEHTLAGPPAHPSGVGGAVLAAPRPVPAACPVPVRGPRLREAHPHVPGVPAEPAGAAFAVALVHGDQDGPIREKAVDGFRPFGR